LFCFSLFVILFARFGESWAKWLEKTKKSKNLQEDEGNSNFLSLYKDQENVKVVNLVRTFQRVDEFFIRSFLDSAEIPNYLEFSHVSRLFPGVKISGYTDSVISVFEDDVPEARQIVLDYVSGSTKSTSSESSSRPFGRAPPELLL